MDRGFPHKPCASRFDNESKFPIVGAKVVLFSEGFSSKTITDFDGLFLLENVPVGKHEIQVSYTLYSSNTLTVEVSSGKEVVVQVPLVEFISEQKGSGGSWKEKG